MPLPCMMVAFLARHLRAHELSTPACLSSARANRATVSCRRTCTNEYMNRRTSREMSCVYLPILDGTEAAAK